ncbi:hypothetical protein NIES4071_98660 [Calothrix sp. NIES-4071]|nr:hypothetical protein NIES4071_98660 [Calothrix sp. NIES-4071]BAZ64130.1 hypothetical protein NIES4105_98590 [Calothrix sp. NIES-4105]
MIPIFLLKITVNELNVDAIKIFTCAIYKLPIRVRDAIRLLVMEVRFLVAFTHPNPECCLLKHLEAPTKNWVGCDLRYYSQAV